MLAALAVKDINNVSYVFDYTYIIYNIDDTSLDFSIHMYVCVCVYNAVWLLVSPNRTQKTIWTTFSSRHFKYISLNENVYILVQISLRLGPDKGPVHNTPALVQTMAWYRVGDKPLFELMITKFSYVTSSQRVNQHPSTFVKHYLFDTFLK